MPNSSRKKSSKKISRSARLRKYESVYEVCVKKAQTAYKKKTKCAILDNKSHVRQKTEKTRELSSERKQEKRKSLEKKEKKLNKTKEKKSPKKSKDRKRPLNTYQMFVRDESQKDKYKGMTSTERMSAISKVWKKIKDKK